MNISQRGGRIIAVLILLVLIASVWYYLTDRRKVRIVQPTADSTNVSTQSKEVPAYLKLQAGEIDISSCIQYPKNFIVTVGSKITFINRDEVVHVISFSPKISYVVASQSEKTIPTDFMPTSGQRPYSCDGVARSGLINFINK